MKKLTRAVRARSLASFLSLAIPFAAIAADPATPPTKPIAGASGNATGVETEVKNLRQRYWAKGDATELEVIQNRQYKKLGKFRLGVAGGVVSTDPFLSVKQAGGSLGYYFGENWALQFTGAKYFVSNSSALDTLVASGGAALLNRPKGHYALEALVSPLYGKLSFFGNKIIYFDFYVLGGLGVLSGDTGNSTSAHLGLGQQIYLTKNIAIDLELRVLRYSEKLAPTNAALISTALESQRSNSTWVSQVGLAFLL